MYWRRARTYASLSPVATPLKSSADDPGFNCAGIDESVCFPGRIGTEELAALLSISDVLISPRRAGTTAPIKVLDYLKSGTPIVAADTPANRAILSAENAVITRLIPAEFAAGILRLATARVWVLNSPGAAAKPCGANGVHRKTSSKRRFNVMTTSSQPPDRVWYAV